MEEAVSWIQAMIADGHTLVGIRVNEPWASAVVASGVVPTSAVSPSLPTEGDYIAFVAGNGLTYYATLVVG